VYELIQAGERTYYIDSPSKIGIYRMGESDVCLIDSGIDKDVGRKALRILEDRQWKLDMIINTHSHADHVGGNNFLQSRTGCKIYAAGEDAAIIQNSILNTSFIYGGFPSRAMMKNKLLYSMPSDVRKLDGDFLPDGLETIRLDGHSFAMLGLKTSDNVWFLADALASETVLEKYCIPFLYDVRKYLETLSIVEELTGDLFIPSHSAVTQDPKPLVEANRRKILEIASKITTICRQGTPFEDILKDLFDHYGLTMDINQYILVGCTIRSFLSYLNDEGHIDIVCDNNKILWKSVS
jgi:glyoxylase-like metal-dependent hydrolase (beta-lactamase superfamily II)